MTDFSGRTALITGASRGIGAAVAKGLAAAGAHVILLARTQGGLEAVDDEIRAAGGNATLLPIDLGRNAKDTEKLGPTILERFGGLDIFIGNAGILGPLTPVHQVKMKDWERSFETNVMANIRLLQSLHPLLQASSAGRVVFTGSGTANRPKAYWGPYRSSKAALHVMAQTYAQECAKTNIRVNVVDPGAVDTKMLDEAYPGGYQGGDEKSPEELVPVFLKLVSPDCSLHGEIVSV